MALAPAFVATGRIGLVNVSAANAATDGTGTITSLITGASTGTRINAITVKNAATSAAAVVNIFLSADGGTTWRIIDSLLVSAVTQSTTVGGYKVTATYDDLILPSTSHVIGVTTTIAQSTNVLALAGDL